MDMNLSCNREAGGSQLDSCETEVSLLFAPDSGLPACRESELPHQAPDTIGVNKTDEHEKARQCSHSVTINRNVNQ